MGEVHEEAENDYMLGMKYKEIAEKYGISLNTVKSWKQRYGWERGGGKKDAHKKKKKVCTQKKNAYTEEEKDSPEEENAVDRDELFCQYYAKSFNAVRSYMRVYHCSYQSAAVSAHNKLKNPKIKERLEEIRRDKMERMLPKEEDVAELQSRIAFADLSDVVNVSAYGMSIKNPDLIDWQTVKAIKNTAHGVAIELKDSQKAIDWLDKHGFKGEDDGEDNEGVVFLPPVKEVDEDECFVDATAEAEDIHGKTGV